MSDCNNSWSSIIKNVNSSLISDSAEILNSELKPDDLIQISSSNTMSTNQTQCDSEIPDDKWFKDYANDRLTQNTSVTLNYHNSEIELVNKIISCILSITKWVSLGTLFIVSICVLFDKNYGAMISGGLGAVVDIILGILAGTFNSTLKSKKSYFDAEIDTSKLTTMLGLVDCISDTKKKDDVIVDILRNHFDISNKKTE